MRLETVSKVKGWIAFVCLAIWIGTAVFILPTDPRGETIMVSGFSGIVGIGVGISWMRGRKRMRELEYAGRVLANGR